MIFDEFPPVPPLDELRRVHLVGIGGSGMSSLARLLIARGVEVSGCDAKDSLGLMALRALGVDVHVGHDAAHVQDNGDIDALVVSTAIRPTNPDVLEATRRGVRILPRSVVLGSCMQGHRTIAVAGTHGKTTTTSMITVALQHCGADPSFAIGGTLNAAGTSAHAGTGEFFVAEVDESDRSFLIYEPQVSVVTYVELDHLDVYSTMADYEAAFDEFTERVVPGGYLVICADEPGARRLAERTRARGRDVRTYGESADADVRICNLQLSGLTSTCDLEIDGQPVGRLSLQVPGRHNVLNATAAFCAGLGLGLPADQLLAGLAGFTGSRRRFEFKGAAAGVRVYDDYAHHPTELETVLRVARSVVGDGRVIAIYQPRFLARLSSMYKELGAALGGADEVVVMEIMLDGEEPIPGVTAVLVADNVPLPPGRVRLEQSWSAVPGLVASLVRPGDLVLTLGSGDVGLIGPEVLEILENGQPSLSEAAANFATTSADVAAPGILAENPAPGTPSDEPAPGTPSDEPAPEGASG